MIVSYLFVKYVQQINYKEIYNTLHEKITCSNVILFLDYTAIPEMPLNQATVSFSVIQCCKCKATSDNQ